VPSHPCARAGRRRQAAFPVDDHVQLELFDERRFGNGMVYLAYRTSAAAR